MGKTKEFEVVVNQVPGSITWNFDELKQNVSDKLSVYRNMQYSDDNIADAKKDLASLRKLSKAVNDKKIEIKKACMKPYDEIEKQAKELIALIGEPINVIDEQVKEYTKRQKEKARKAIYEYMDAQFAQFDQKISDKLKERVYDPAWENTTAKKSDWMKSIENAAEQTKSDLDVIHGVEPEFESHAMESYKKNLTLSDAMAKVQEMRAQKEAILRAQEEKKRQEEERARKEAESRPEPDPTAEPVSEMGKTIKSIEKQGYQQTVTRTIDNPVTQQCQPQQVKPYHTIQIIATDEQLKKICDYIHFIGCKYREM